MSGYSQTREVRIEQALAFGRSWQWIRVNIGASDREIQSAIRHMAAALEDDPWWIAQMGARVVPNDRAIRRDNGRAKASRRQCANTAAALTSRSGLSEKEAVSHHATA